MIEINLIPDVKREFLKSRALRNTVISTSIFIGVIVVGAAVVLGIVLAGQMVTESMQDGTIKTEGAKLMEIEDIDKMLTIQSQLATIKGQHDQKSVDSRLFDVIAVINPPAPNNAAISNISLDPVGGTIKIEGSAVNGYSALEVFKKTITNTFVQTKQGDEDVKVPLASDIVPGGASFGSSADGQRVLRFSFTFSYPSELFANSDSPVTIVTPERQIDVTDSKLGVPESLFGERAADIDDAAGGGQ